MAKSPHDYVWHSGAHVRLDGNHGIRSIWLLCERKHQHQFPGQCGESVEYHRAAGYDVLLRLRHEHCHSPDDRTTCLGAQPGRCMATTLRGTNSTHEGAVPLFMGGIASWLVPAIAGWRWGYSTS